MEAAKVLHKKKLISPKLRFKGIEFDWQNLLYGEIYTFYTTNSFSRENLNYECGEVKNIHYGDIHTRFATLFDIQKEEVPFVNLDIDVKKLKNESYCQEKDLVIADASEDYADIGKTIELVNLNKEKIIAGLHTFLARPNKHEMAKGFAGYLVQSWNFRKQVMIIAQGTKVLSLSTNRLANLKLNIPTLPEQQKIASFLSAVDEKIQQLTRKKELLEQYKKGVMQQLFSVKLRFNDVNGNAFPKWEEKKLQEVASINTGSSNRQDSGLDGEFTFFDRSQDIRTSSIFLFDGEAVIVAGEGQEFVPKHFIGKFDLHQRTYAIMNYKHSIGKYLFYYIYYHRNYFLSQAVGSTVKSLRLPMFQNMNIKVPEIKEQKKIANYLSSIDNKIEIVNKQITQTQTFKKGLLQQMFV